MNEFVALVEVNWYNEHENDTVSETIVLTDVATYEEVARRVEAYYGSDIEGMNITLLEGPFLTVNTKAAADILTGDISKEKADDSMRGCGIR